MVGGAVAYPVATTEPCVSLSISHGSSVGGLLSQAPFAVCLVVAVTVEQCQVGVPIVRSVPIPMMYLGDVFCRKV